MALANQCTVSTIIKSFDTLDSSFSSSSGSLQCSITCLHNTFSNVAFLNGKW